SMFGVQIARGSSKTVVLVTPHRLRWRPIVLAVPDRRVGRAFVVRHGKRLPKLLEHPACQLRPTRRIRRRSETWFDVAAAHCWRPQLGVVADRGTRCRGTWELPGRSAAICHTVVEVRHINLAIRMGSNLLRNESAARFGRSR